MERQEIHPQSQQSSSEQTAQSAYTWHHSTQLPHVSHWHDNSARDYPFRFQWWYSSDQPIQWRWFWIQMFLFRLKELHQLWFWLILRRLGSGIRQGSVALRIVGLNCWLRLFKIALHIRRLFVVGMSVWLAWILNWLFGSFQLFIESF
jgi:hypothetical protein